MSEIFYLSPLYKMTAKHWPHWNETPGSPTDRNFDRINRFLWNCSILLNQQIWTRTKLWPYWNIQSWQLPIKTVSKSIDSCKTLHPAASTAFQRAAGGLCEQLVGVPSLGHRQSQAGTAVLPSQVRTDWAPEPTTPQPAPSSSCQPLHNQAHNKLSLFSVALSSPPNKWVREKPRNSNFFFHSPHLLLTDFKEF